MSRLIIIILIIISFQASGQEKQKRVLLYSNNEKYLIPLIESYLEELTDNGHVLFSDITNLNEVSANITSEKYLREAINFISKKISIESDSAKQIQKKIFEILTEYNYFINININKLESFLEYQFYLYDVSSFIAPRDTSKFSMPLTSIKPRYRTSFLVDIRDPSYPQRIKTEIIKMFPESNSLPFAIISAGLNRQKEFYLGMGDTLLLSGIFSIDKETPTSDMSFLWDNKTDDSLKKRGNILMLINDKFCSVIVNSEGKYIITLKVNDGVSYSKEDTVYITGSKRPRINVPYKKNINFYQKSIFEKQTTKSERIPILCTNFRTIESSKVIINNQQEQVDTLSLISSFYKSETIKYLTSNASNIDSFLVRPRGIRGMTISKNSTGVDLNIQYFPSVSFREKYEVRVVEWNLASKPSTIVFGNDAYHSISFFLEYQRRRFFFVDTLSSTAVQSFSVNSYNLGFSAKIASYEDMCGLEQGFSLGVQSNEKLKLADSIFYINTNFCLNTDFFINYRKFRLGIRIVNTFWPVTKYLEGETRAVSTIYFLNARFFLEYQIFTSFPMAIGLTINSHQNAPKFLNYRYFQNDFASVGFYLKKYIYSILNKRVKYKNR